MPGATASTVAMAFVLLTFLGRDGKPIGSDSSPATLRRCPYHL